MTRFTLIFLMLAAPALPAAAQSVGECGEVTSLRHLPEPWADHTASYAEGEVRLAVLDTVEPASASMHLMVISPPRDESGQRQCRVISQGAGGAGYPFGFMGLDFAARSASYDPKTGLVITMPMDVYNTETGLSDDAQLSVSINQSSGEIGVEIEGP